ncbi:hypothetical protein V8F20_004144 [Naviculisporaceae sp. PSN 640]
MKVTLAISLALWAAGTQAKCHADNCYRALFPCSNPTALSSAIAFCNGLGPTPTRATLACGTSTARYSSACVCGPTCTPTTTTTTTTTTTSTACPTPTALIPNGDFECTSTSASNPLSLWTPEVPDSSATWSLHSPGNTGSFAFEAHLLSAPATPQLGVSVRVTSQAFAVTPGVQYRLKFASWFDNLASGFIGVMVNEVPIYTVDAADQRVQPVREWHDNEVLYTPAAGVVSLRVRFEFLFGNTHWPSIQRVDSVTFTAV